MDNPTKFVAEMDIRKRALIVTGIFPPDSGGPARFVPKLAPALSAMGWHVIVITLSDVEKHEADDLGFQVIRIPRNINRVVRTVLLAAALFRYGRQSHVWLIQGLAFSTSVIGTLLGVPQVHKIVGDQAWERSTGRNWYSKSLDSFQSEGHGAKIAFLKWLRTFPLNFARKIVVPSRYLGGIVRGWGVRQERIEVVYNAVNFREGLAQPRSSGILVEPKLITVCRLVPWKGVAEILLALQELPGASLTVVGDGPSRQELEALAVQFGVAERVTWVGNVANSRVEELLARHDIFILNSTYEGLPHVVLEAFGQRISVIATRAGGTPEIVEDRVNGLLIEPTHVDELVEAVNNLSSDPDLRMSLGNRGYSTLCGHFSFPIMCQSIDKILKEAAKP